MNLTRQAIHQQIIRFLKMPYEIYPLRVDTDAITILREKNEDFIMPNCYKLGIWLKNLNIFG